MAVARSERPARPRVLFISADPVGSEMRGLGIRYWELAQVLAERAQVTVAHGGSEERVDSEGHASNSAERVPGSGRRHAGAGMGAKEVQIVPYRPHAPEALRPLIAAADMIVTHPQWPRVNAWLQRCSARVVSDLYCPETLETLELLKGSPARTRRLRTAITVDRLHASLRTAHHCICASEKQRDLWLGSMLALRLIDEKLYDRDPGLREVIDLVPFGLSSEPPRRESRGGPREVVRGLDPDSEIVLWNGGIWNWLDAETAIRAVAQLCERRPKVRLVFMGAPAGGPASVAGTSSARALACELGLLDAQVHFHDDWVPYAERDAWLTQADCALYAHTDHLEARFAYRTRVLDCFWARLPIVCTAGDALSERIEREGLGELAPPSDPGALAAAVERVLDHGREAYTTRLAAAAAEQTWERVATPLVRWMQAAHSSSRIGDTPGALRKPLAQQLHELAYLAVGRRALARRTSS